MENRKISVIFLELMLVAVFFSLYSIQLISIHNILKVLIVGITYLIPLHIIMNFQVKNNLTNIQHQIINKQLIQSSVLFVIALALVTFIGKLIIHLNILLNFTNLNGFTIGHIVFSCLLLYFFLNIKLENKKIKYLVYSYIMMISVLVLYIIYGSVNGTLGTIEYTKHPYFEYIYTFGAIQFVVLYQGIKSRKEIASRAIKGSIFAFVIIIILLLLFSSQFSGIDVHNHNLLHEYEMIEDFFPALSVETLTVFFSLFIINHYLILIALLMNGVMLVINLNKNKQVDSKYLSKLELENKIEEKIKKKIYIYYLMALILLKVFGVTCNECYYNILRMGAISSTIIISLYLVFSTWKKKQNIVAKIASILIFVNCAVAIISLIKY